MTTRRPAADGFYRHLREWFTAFCPRQRGAAENTITSCRQTWNMLLGYVAEHHHIGVEKVTFTMVDRVAVPGFLECLRATKSWMSSTDNQRLACFRSLFIYTAAAEPTLTILPAPWSGLGGTTCRWRSLPPYGSTSARVGAVEPCHPTG